MTFDGNNVRLAQKRNSLITHQINGSQMKSAQPGELQIVNHVSFHRSQVRTVTSSRPHDWSSSLKSNGDGSFNLWTSGQKPQLRASTTKLAR